MSELTPSFSSLNETQSGDRNDESSGQLPSAIAQLLSIPLNATTSTSQVAPVNPNLNVSAFANLDLTTISPDLIQQVRNDFQRQSSATTYMSETKQTEVTQLPTPVHSGYIDASKHISDSTLTSSTSQTPDTNVSLPNDYEGILAALKKFQNPPQDPRVRQTSKVLPTYDSQLHVSSSTTLGPQDSRTKPVGNSPLPPSHDLQERSRVTNSHSQPLRDPRIRPKPNIFQPQTSRSQRKSKALLEQRAKPNIFRQRNSREDSHKYHDLRGKGYVDRDAVSTYELTPDPRSVIKYDDYLGDDSSRYNSSARRKKPIDPVKEMGYPHKVSRTNEWKHDHTDNHKNQNKLPVFEFSDPSNDPSIPKGPRADYISAEKPYPIEKHNWSHQVESNKATTVPANPKKSTTISPAVLIELSKIAENGTIFTILEQIRRMQIDREEELFEQRKRLMEEHDKERNKLHAKEILGTLDPREAEALEQKLFTELRALDKNIVAEMDKIVQKQQQALQDANVPLFFTTTDKDAITKQHKILGLLSEMAP